jgi:hypothetical protein
MKISQALVWIFALGLRVALADSESVLDNLDAQRRVIASERSEAAKAYDAKDRACYSDFAVSVCLRQVASERRAVLNELKQKDLVLARQERTEKAAQQRVRLEEKAHERLEMEKKISPEAIESSQMEKRSAQSLKLQDHASSAKIPAARSSAPKDSNAPTQAQRESKQAAYDKKILDAKKRIEERKKRLDQPIAAPAPPLPLKPPLQ